MSMQELQPVGDGLQKQLRKAFRYTQQQITTLQDTVQECFILIESLSNMAEQLQCSRQAADDHHQGTVLLLALYPDLQSRLEVKLIDSMEGVVCKLQGRMKTLQGIESKLYYQYTHAVAAYQRNSSQYDIDMVTHRTSTWPSVADMLLWLADTHSHYTAICVKRQWMLDIISYDSAAGISMIQTLPKKWKLTNSEKNRFQDILAQVSFFMADGS